MSANRFIRSVELSSALIKELKNQIDSLQQPEIYSRDRYPNPLQRKSPEPLFRSSFVIGIRGFFKKGFCQ